MNSAYHSHQFQNSFSKQENQKFVEEFTKITQRFQELMSDGLAPHSEETQFAVKQQYEFTCRFWQPDREAFKSLAIMYILPSEYQKYYQNIDPNLGQYLYEAICHWSDLNLE